MMKFELISTSDTSFTIQIGTSTVTFTQREDSAFYHYAINIPGNQFTIIKDWVRTHYQLNKQGGLTEKYDEQFDADSMFIEDPAGNLIQLIGRRNRDFFGHLTNEAFYNISEITIVTNDVENVGEQLQDIGLPLLNGFIANPKVKNYLGTNDTFVVLMEEGKKINFLKNKLEIHPLQIVINEKTNISLDEHGAITISERDNHGSLSNSVGQ